MKINGVKIPKDLEEEMKKIIEEESEAGAKEAIDYINSPQYDEDVNKWRKNNPKLVESDNKLNRKQSFPLLKEICDDFAEYKFLPNDLYKGKVKGGFNIYYKKGDYGVEGIVTGEGNIKRFELDTIPCNFTCTTGYGANQKSEKGWSGSPMMAVLEKIKDTINSTSGNN